ncbi:MAG TPA: hypothetical protein VF823_10705 [Anaerolineales bacterium]
MPIIEDVLWKNPGNPGMIVVTCHASLEHGKKLLMDSGAALEASRRIPGIERQCAQAIRTLSQDGVYGFLPVRPSRPEDKIIGFGIFQNRLSREAAPDPELIRYSMECLRQYLAARADLKVRMDYPGGEDGQLSAADIQPLLVPLPPTLTICYTGELIPLIPLGRAGVKDLFLQVERWLQEGRFAMAVEHLVDNGYERAEAVEQVSAVQRQLRARADKYAEIKRAKDRMLFR